LLPFYSREKNINHINHNINIIPVSHQLNKLNDENEYLKKVNISLMKDIHQLKENTTHKSGLSVSSLSGKEIKIQSEKKIDGFVDNILNNPDTNIYWLPDIVERRLYKKIAIIIVNLLESTVENSDITFLGHKIRFVMDQELDSPIQKKIMKTKKNNENKRK